MKYHTKPVEGKYKRYSNPRVSQYHMCKSSSKEEVVHERSHSMSLRHRMSKYQNNHRMMTRTALEKTDQDFEFISLDYKRKNMTTVRNTKPTKPKAEVYEVPALNDFPDILDEPGPSVMTVANAVGEINKDDNCSMSINEALAQNSTDTIQSTATYSLTEDKALIVMFQNTTPSKNCTYITVTMATNSFLNVNQVFLTSQNDTVANMSADSNIDYYTNLLLSSSVKDNLPKNDMHQNVVTATNTLSHNEVSMDMSTMKDPSTTCTDKNPVTATNTVSQDDMSTDTSTINDPSKICTDKNPVTLTSTVDE